jgi:hypothetical protein
MDELNPMPLYQLINWNLCFFFSPFLFLSVKSRQGGTLDIINVTRWHWMRSFLFPLWHSLYRVTPSIPWERPPLWQSEHLKEGCQRPSDPRKGGGGGSLFVPNNVMVSCGSSYCVVVLCRGVMEPHQVGLIRDSVDRVELRIKAFCQSRLLWHVLLGDP